MKCTINFIGQDFFIQINGKSYSAVNNGATVEIDYCPYCGGGLDCDANNQVFCLNENCDETSGSLGMLPLAGE